MSSPGPRPIAGFAAGLILACAVPAAAEPDAIPSELSLACRGTALTAGPTHAARLTADLDAFRTAQAAGVARARLGRMDGEMLISVRDGQVRIRPSAALAPDGASGRRSADGWYPLSGVTLGDGRIAGLAPWRDPANTRFRLLLDRRSGELRFGSFEGDCQPSDPALVGP